MTPPVLVVAGPTGVGKSSLAVDVALTIGAEIVSADSRQVYRGLDVGTATPTELERGGVPHHMLDVVDPDVGVTAGWFADRAREAIRDVQARGRPVVVVGGSTLYVHALVEGLADLPPVPPDVARAVSDEASTAEGRRRLFAELQRRDPVAAATLDPTKSQRLTRYVGLARELGRSVSEVWGQNAPAPHPSRLVVLDRPRDELYGRIDRRAETMWDRGLAAELDGVLRRWPGAGPLLASTIGYREVLDAPDRDDVAAVLPLIQRNTRRYAKRQLTWYRRYPEAVWLDARSATPDSLLEALSWERAR